MTKMAFPHPVLISIYYVALSEQQSNKSLCLRSLHEGVCVCLCVSVSVCVSLCECVCMCVHTHKYFSCIASGIPLCLAPKLCGFFHRGPANIWLTLIFVLFFIVVVTVPGICVGDPTAPCLFRDSLEGSQDSEAVVLRAQQGKDTSGRSEEVTQVPPPPP